MELYNFSILKIDFYFVTTPKQYIKTSLIPVQFILAVMEIEAWFLAEHTHFTKIHPSITVDAIKHKLGFDPEVDELAHRAEPAKDLDECYQIGNMRYEKGKSLTINALDYPAIYLEYQNKIADLKQLIENIDEFLNQGSKTA